MRGGRHRSREKERLPIATSELAKEVPLLGRLDPFGDRPEPEARRELRERGDDRLSAHAVVFLMIEARDETAVDLEEVDGQALQVGERRVAGAEIVHAEVDAERLHR